MFIVELIAILITISALFVWNRAEGRNDSRHLQNQLDSIRDLTYAIREEGRIFRLQMMEESKDFHNRLCEIERSRR